MTITIPQRLTKGKELIVIPREEYEALMVLKEAYEFQPTVAQKKALEKARMTRKAGKALTVNKLKKRLGFTN